MPTNPADEPKHKRDVKPRSMRRQEGKHEPPTIGKRLRKWFSKDDPQEGDR